MILDLELPEMSGAQLLKIMSAYRRLSRVPVLVLSGARESDVPRDCTVVGFVSKPFDVDELLSRVEECIDAARAT